MRSRFFESGMVTAQQKGTLADEMIQVRWCQVMSTNMPVAGFTAACAAWLLLGSSVSAWQPAALVHLPSALLPALLAC